MKKESAFPTLSINNNASQRRAGAKKKKEKI